MTARRRSAAALVVVALVASPAGAAARPVSVIEDDASLLRSGPGVRDATLDDMAGLGAGVVRILVRWEDYDAASAPAWADLDAAVGGVTARGMRPLLTVSGPGPASASGCRPRDGACRPDPAAFGRFVAAVGRRYPEVRLWSIWNEPNIPQWLRPQSVVRRGRVVLAAPELYRSLVRSGVAALHAAGHRGDTMLVGETAPVLTPPFGPPAGRPTSALRFVRALLSRPLPGAGWAHHAYTAGGVRSPAAPSPPQALGLSSLPVLEAELRRAAHRRMTSGVLPLWITEGGFQTDPPDPFFGVPPDTQATWLNETDWLLGRDRHVRSVAQYLDRDEPARSSFQSGLRWADGRPKPAWAAYRAPIWVVRHGAEAVVWGEVRPRGAALVAVQWRAPAARTWSSRALPRGRELDRAVRAPHGSRWRLLWRDAAGIAHASRIAREAAGR